MSYIYRLEDGLSLIPNKDNFDLNYISVKNKGFINATDRIAIYCKNEHGEGICGFGIIKKAKKSSEIDPAKTTKFLNRNYFQVAIELSHLSRTPIVPDHVLKQFPSYNYNSFQKPYNPYILYWSASCHWDYNYLIYRFHYDFGLSNLLGYFSEQHWKFFLHILREQNARYFWHRILPSKNPKCRKCGFTSERQYLLEIHDTTHIDLKTEYKPIEISDFIILCPTCHKEEHLKLRDG